MERVIDMCCRRPAELMNIYSSKGSIKKGKIADIVVFKPDSIYTLQ